ncbi:MAG: Lhr family helicase, partial [Nitrospira sp.]
NSERVRQLLTGGEDSTCDAAVLGWMESIGPTTTVELAERLHLPIPAINAAMVRLEGQGQVLRGRFRPLSALSPLRPVSEASPQSSPLSGEAGSASTEWCHRRLLARIHRLTIGILRKEVEPVTASDFMRFLMQWQHVVPGSRQHGDAGLMEVIKQLAGFEAAASVWEPQLLRTRMAKYVPELLDRLCLSGSVSWGRLSPHPKLAQGGGETERRRIIPTSIAPISVFARDERDWLVTAFHRDVVAPGPDPFAPLSSVAQDVCRALQQQGASFFADLVKITTHLATEVEQGLWELVAAGLVTADGFDNLRALMDPHRRGAEGRERSRRPRHSPGRWSLLRSMNMPMVALHTSMAANPVLSTRSSALPIEKVARQLLRRYGVVFRDLLARESLVSSWRDLLVQYRRMEMAGEVRGGRFVSGFAGEHFSLPEAVDALRGLRKNDAARTGVEVKISACDPLNLAGIMLPGPRLPAVPTNFLILKDGVVVRTVIGRQGETGLFAQEQIGERAAQPRP